jgi:hypothetical protein
LRCRCDDIPFESIADAVSIGADNVPWTLKGDTKFYWDGEQSGGIGSDQISGDAIVGVTFPHDAHAETESRKDVAFETFSRTSIIGDSDSIAFGTVIDSNAIGYCTDLVCPSLVDPGVISSDDVI